MNCREFLAEFEERCSLTESATLHLNDCPGCKKTSVQQTRVWQMIDAMQRVDAPTDFEFRVKARIAQGKPAEIQTRFLPSLRYVLPVGLVVLILSFVALNAVYFSNNNSALIVAETTQTPDAAEIPASNSSSEQVAAINNFSQSFTNEDVTVSSSNQSLPAETRPKEALFVTDKATRRLPVKSRKENVTSDADGAGSTDKTVTQPKVLTPEGFSSNKSSEIKPNANNPKQVTRQEILSLMGIETIVEDGREKVKAVKSMSLAERSGVKVGDVIEAIDGRPVGGESAGTGTFESKRLTVRRGAEKIEIVLQNK